MNLIVWTLVFCVPMHVPVNKACPTVCSCGKSGLCNGTAVDCYHKRLTGVPTNIPTDTCILDLGRNQITTVGDNALDGLSSLVTLTLDGNPLHCDCILVDFIKFFQSRKITLGYFSEPTCFTPSNLTGVLLRNLSSEDMDCEFATATSQVLETLADISSLIVPRMPIGNTGTNNRPRVNKMWFSTS